MKTEFIYLACRFGSENHCKQEIADNIPGLRFSYSQPGFLTFKVVDGALDFTVLNRLLFPRTVGVSRGQINLETDGPEKIIEDGIISPDEAATISHLHLWDRDLGSGDDALIRFLNQGKDWRKDSWAESYCEFAESRGWSVNRRAAFGERVLNVIRINETSGWIGQHNVQSPQQSFPGGVSRFTIPSTVVSRAYYKTREAMVWSRFPFQQDDVCVELGSAPGGSAQALLEQGMSVVGIDPAEMDPSILANPGFFHIKKRGSVVRKKDLADVSWIFSDSNVAPKHTLDTVQDIVTNQHVHARGLVLTLKLLQPKLAAGIDPLLDRIRDWGFRYVRARQLAFNRNEFCVAALRKKSVLRFGRTKTRPKQGQPG